MKIWFNDHRSRNRGRSILRKAELIRLLETILKEMDQERAEVGLTLTENNEIRRLNRRYRGIDRPTDVLAFVMQEGSRPMQKGKAYPVLLGDIVISTEKAESQAQESGHSLKKEVAILIIHGFLHLLGYDHERSRAAAKAMGDREKALLKAVSDII